MKKILYIIGFLLITNAVFSQAKIGTDGSVEPTGNFPAMKDQFFKGGMRVVADTTARNAIPSLFRKNGMLVYDQALKKLWVLDSTVSPIWSEFASGTSVDSSTYATRARLYKVADSLSAVNAATYVTLSTNQTITGKKIFNDTVTTNKELVINDGVGYLEVGHEMIEVISTGLVEGGNISIGSPTTTFSISAGEGHVVNTVTKRYKEVEWSAFNNQTVTVVAPIVHILIDSNGAIVQQSSVPTRAQRRSQIYIGYVAISGGVIIAATPSSQVVSQPVNQSYDFFDAFGLFNVTGNLLTVAGTNMNINKSSGTIFKAGSNFQTDPNDPNVKSQAAANPLTFQYCTSAAGSSTGTNTTNFTGANYDNGGVITAIAGSSNQATIQRIYLYPTGTVRVQYGATIYNSLANALAAVNTESFTPNPSFSGNAILLGYVVLTKGATALNDPTNARVIQASRFGDIASSAGNTAVIDSIRLENTGVLHVSPAAFSVVGTTGVITQALANQSPFTVFRRASGTGTPSFGSIDSSYFGGSFANQVRGVGDSRYGLLGSANTWTAKNTFTDSIVGQGTRFNASGRLYKSSGQTGWQYYSNTTGWFAGLDQSTSDSLFIITYDGSYNTALRNVFAAKKSGEIGLGTNNPSVGLHVRKDVSGGIGGQIAIDNSATSALNNTAELSFLTNFGASATGTRNGRILVVNEDAGNGAARMEFHTWNGSASAERLRISSGGNITAQGSITATAQGNNITIGVDSSVTTTTYTLVLGDAGYLKRCSNASAITITVPTNASVAFPIGTTIYFSQQGAGKVSVSPASSTVTIQSEGNLLGTAGQHAVIGLIKVNSDRWLLVGNRG